MAYKRVQNLLHGQKYRKTMRNGGMQISTMRNSHSEEHIPFEWYDKAFPQMVKLSQLLKNVGSIDGRLVNIDDYSTVFDERIEQRMQTFKSLARAFLGSPLMQQAEGSTFHSMLTSKGMMMGQQIVLSCLNFLADKAISYDPDSTSWMRPAPARAPESPSRKWGEVLVMFNHLLKCLRTAEKGLLLHVSKLEAMKEGLSQIKDVLVDRNIGYKEARHQESLVQKKLGKTLGHSSRCLFTLLVYYLFGSIRDIEVEVCGGVYGSEGGDRFCLYMGRILTSDEEKMVWSGVKQLDRALGLFKFVWETAKMKGVLELQGHLWCVGAEERSFKYRGNVFFVHRINI
ncbi:unnamed protein product, partial [Vitis vinifera]